MELSRSELLTRKARTVLRSYEIPENLLYNLAVRCQESKKRGSLEADALAFAKASKVLRTTAESLLRSDSDDGDQILGLSVMSKVCLLVARSMDAVACAENDTTMHANIKDLAFQAWMVAEALRQDCLDVLYQIHTLKDLPLRQRRSVWQRILVRRALMLQPGAEHAWALASELC